MKLIKIVFIDDGINECYVPENQEFESYIVYENSVKPEKISTNHFGHANLCFRVFHDHVRAPYHLISIKILDAPNGKGNIFALIAALNWCADKEIDIIHMSVGTQQYQDFPIVNDAVSRLARCSNTIIIAACNNANTLTLPACLANVIGVRHCSNQDLRNTFAYNSSAYDQIEVITCVDDLHVSHGGNEIIKHGTNSIAVPYIAAHICNYIVQGSRNINEIRTALKHNATMKSSFFSRTFYRSIIKREELDIPIIALTDYSLSSIMKFKKIIKDFIQRDYRAIGLSPIHETCVSDLIFNIPTKKSKLDYNLMEMYYNFTLPDIIFLQADFELIQALPNHLQPDIILTTFNNICVDTLQMDLNDNDLINKIIRLF